MEKAPRWRSGSLGATLLVLAVVTVVLVLAWRLPIRGGRCAGTLQFIGATAGDQYGRELLARDCGGVDVRRMLLLDYVFLIVYGVVLALICRIGAGRLYRGRMRTVAIWAGRGALAAAGADALENLMLLLVPDAVRTGERAGDTVALQLAQAFALIKWAALFPAVLISLLVVLTVAARAIAAIRPQPRVPPVLTGPGPRKGHHAAWAHNYWLPASHEAKKGGIGISLSGGGIRSGTFALGALQVFAETGLLARAKFISTVSGGGYTGGAHQLLRARGGRKLPPPPDGPGLELPEVTVKEAFAAGSPEEAHIRRHGKYIADGAAQWVRAVLTVLRNVLVNLALLYGVLFVLARPLGAAYAAAAPWTRQLFFVGETPACRPPGRPPVTSFPCVWAWPNFSLGTWLAVGLPMALALVFWVANGWPAGARSNRPGRLRRVFLDLAGGLAVLGIVVALLVVALPVLVRVFQWLAARSGDTRPPEIAVIAALATVATTIWNMASGRKSSGATKPSSGLSKLVTGFGFATRAITSFAVVAALVVLALVVLASHLATAVRDHNSWLPVPESPLDQWWWGVAAAILLLGIFFDQTRLSLHPFYKRRLATAFAVERVSSSEAREIDYGIRTVLSDYGRPFPDGGTSDRETPTLVLCAAANVSGQAVAPPGRRVTSFVFCHDYVGGPGVGYVCTARLERLLRSKPYRSDITLVAAMALSGAAFASAMGRMSGPFNILLSLTNARLGAWLPNPRYLAQRRAAAAGSQQISSATDAEPAPPLERWRPVLPHVRRLTYLAKEIFSIYSPDDRLVYVTDGGHYENLGLVELLRRRCRMIYCVDASGDTSLAQTLAQAASLAYEELGVQITIDDAPLLSPSSAIDGKAPNLELRSLERRLATKPVVVGRIDYPPEAGLEQPSGVLIIGKAVLTSDLPFPLRAHAARALQFPNEGTADQWFDVDQFNAYLSLGRRVGQRMTTAHHMSSSGRFVLIEAVTILGD